MIITKDHLTGVAVGVGACAIGYYVYKKNQDQVDMFLRKQGIDIPSSSNKDCAYMSLEELVSQKEHLEDLIAEKELLNSNSSVATV